MTGRAKLADRPDKICGAKPWSAAGKDCPPRLLCCRPKGHSGKRHQNAAGHQWNRGVKGEE